jgi:hypothetical protein
VNTKLIAGKSMGFIIGAFLAFPMGTAFLMWLADGSNRGGFDNAKIISARYIASVVVFLLMLIPFFVVAGSREPGATLTWGEAMLAATYVFLLLFWLYGVIPHEFLTWADAELAWRPDKKIIGPEATWTWLSAGFWKAIPITIHKQIIRDLIATLLYVIGLGMFIWAFAFWNDRAKKATEAAATEKRSAYGRPLVAKARG